MVQIRDYPFLDNRIPLADGDNYFENCFTVLLGKNGVGKSRLLSELVSEFARSYRNDYSSSAAGPFAANPLPSKIIAVSTSPFDKFPPVRRSANAPEYSYIGMRSSGGAATNQMALILSAAKGLMSKYLETEQHENLAEIFELLSLDPSLSFIFKINIKPKIEIKKQNGGSVRFSFDGLVPDFFDDDSDVFKEMLEYPILQNYLNENQETRLKIRHALSSIWDELENKKGMFFTLHFDYSSKYKTGFISPKVVSALLTLLEHNLVRLYDLKITKKTWRNDPLEMSLRRASSGEQCLLVMILGIAGQIRDNSLILIDEPEISLHPSWQSRFIYLIINTFTKYQKCHFIIATHSPQIVSRLSHNNCFITTMDDNKLHRAQDFHNRSADYQLTELFDAPGMMNEYVSRLAFTLLSKVRSNKDTDIGDRRTITRLEKIRLNLEFGDPNIELIDSVLEVCEYYASNN
ncbi:UNVERIFIED_CONTAM: AAA family ATPase [Pseudomonas aeruginosa]|nr:ATP-binding protein [Pseudomonas aeruginosa]